MDVKTCFSCSTTKTKSEFGIAKNRGDGCSVYCKVCTSKKSAQKYASIRIDKTCKDCGILYTGTLNQNFCTRICGAKKRLKGIDGYRSCKVCSKQFPYRNSCKVRSSRDKYGTLVGSVKQKLCSKECLRIFTKERNKNWSPTPEMRKAAGLRMTALMKGKKHSPERIARRRLTTRRGASHHFWSRTLCLPCHKETPNYAGRAVSTFRYSYPADV